MWVGVVKLPMSERLWCQSLPGQDNEVNRSVYECSLETCLYRVLSKTSRTPAKRKVPSLALAPLEVGCIKYAHFESYNVRKGEGVAELAL